MATQITCDYCGEPIADRDSYKVEIRVWGKIETPDRFSWSDRITPIGPIAHYHASDERCCWALLLDKVQEAQDALAMSPHAIIEERQKYQEMRGYREEQGRIQAQRAAERDDRRDHARSEWDAIGEDGQLDRIRSVFTDIDEWLSGAEIVARINALSDIDFLSSYANRRTMMRPLVADGIFEERKERGRYSYRLGAVA